MKWPTFEYKISEWTANRREWKLWYAWHPVVLKGFEVPTSGVKLSPDQWIWGETILRCTDHNGNWKYRPVDSKDKSPPGEE